MIWSEELAASLDQSSGVIVFHRIELSRPQQLAQTIADKLGMMVEQNEKALDSKFGSGSGWPERADGNKGEKRGEQLQERRGRSERTRGARGEYYSTERNVLMVADQRPYRRSKKRSRRSLFTRLG